jgi:hypothetical protein
MELRFHRFSICPRFREKLKVLKKLTTDLKIIDQ